MATSLFAWQGFSLAVPTNWNLATHLGHARAGAVTLADLHGPVLTVRWQKSRRPAVSFAKLLASLEKKGATIQRSAGPDGAKRARVRHDSFTGWIIAAGSRLYELETDSPNGGATDFSFRDFSLAREWVWSLYGIQARVSAAFHLARADFHPGRPQLTFRRRMAVLEVGAWPGAQAVLAGRPLGAWARATIPLLRSTGGGATEMEGSAPDTAEFRIGRRGQRLSVRHDRAGNVIVWLRHPRSALSCCSIMGDISAGEPSSPAGGPQRVVDSHLDAIPVRNPLVREMATAAGVRLTAPRKLSVLARMLRTKEAAGEKSFDLDAMGTEVWRACDGRTSIEQIITTFATSRQLNIRQAQVSVVGFLNLLLRRNLIALVRPTEENPNHQVATDGRTWDSESA